MSHHLKFFIDGAWVDPAVPALLDVIDPSTEEAFTQISVGGKADVDRAVAAAKAAFQSFAVTDRSERLALLKRITVSGSKNQVRHIEYLQADGDRTEISIEPIDPQ